jgi:hypothetical protein
MLPPGMHWKGIAHTAVEAELIEQRKLTREEVAACYDIPPPLIGILEYATLANVAEAHRMLYTTILAPVAEPHRGDHRRAADRRRAVDPRRHLRRVRPLRGAQGRPAPARAGARAADRARRAHDRRGARDREPPHVRAARDQPAAVPGEQPQARRARLEGEPPSDEEIQQAAGAIAAMEPDELRRWLRDAHSVSDAIVNYAVSYAASYATNGAHLNGHDEETDAS